MGKSYPLVPRKVPAVETKYRRIKTEIPVPESIPVLEKLRKYECGFCFAKISSQDDRNGSENYLYRFYKPSCNNPDAIPNDSHIEINPR